MKHKRNTIGLQKGNPGNKGGPGRPPEWLRHKCQELLSKGDLIAFLHKVASGEDIEQGVGQDGEVIKIPASVKDRIKAIELLADRGYGKPNQPIEHSGHIATESDEEKKARRESVINRMQELMRENK